MDRVIRGSENSLNSVPINRNMLSKILGTKNSTTSKLLRELVCEGCLEVVKDYVVNESSTCYRVPEEHENAMRIEFAKRNVVVENIIAKKNKTKCNYVDTNEGQLYLNYINSIYISHSISNSEYVLFLPMGGKLLVTEFKMRELGLLKIVKKDIFVKRRDTKSRVYCNFSMLHHKYRPTLRYDGKSLISLDIRNSQPLLAGVMIKSMVKNPSKELTEELDRYIATCNAGMFYEQFIDKDISDEDERRAFKKQFFAEVFFSKVTKRKTKLKKRFIAEYPLIYEEICKIKGGLNPKDKNSYKKFAINLQRFEASIIFDTVNLSLLRDGYGCYNVYDSIVSHSEEVIEEAKVRILKVFSKYGVSPSFKKEYYA